MPLGNPGAHAVLHYGKTIYPSKKRVRKPVFSTPPGRDVVLIGLVHHVAAVEGIGVVAFVHEEAGRDVATKAAQAVEQT